jgi:hypothetical protein
MVSTGHRRTGKLLQGRFAQLPGRCEPDAALAAPLGRA